MRLSENTSKSADESSSIPFKIAILRVYRILAIFRYTSIPIPSRHKLRLGAGLNHHDVVIHRLQAPNHLVPSWGRWSSGVEPIFSLVASPVWVIRSYPQLSWVNPLFLLVKEPQFSLGSVDTCGDITDSSWGKSAFSPLRSHSSRANFPCFGVKIMQISFFSRAKVRQGDHRTCAAAIRYFTSR